MYSTNTNQWIIHVRRSIDEDDDPEIYGIDAISIFTAPKPRIQTRPQCYAPRLVAIGPYRYLSPELQMMQIHKTLVARRLRMKQAEGFKFQTLVDHLSGYERKIRSRYDRILAAIDGESLAWIVAVDSCFLLEFLTSRRDPDVVRDVMVMENQIPLFVLRETNEFLSKTGNDRIRLDEIAAAFCDEIAPIKSRTGVETGREADHLLDLLYGMMIPKWDTGGGEVGGGGGDEKTTSLHGIVLSSAKRLAFSRPVIFAAKLWLGFVCSFWGLVIVKRIGESIMGGGIVGREFPSASELPRSGIGFSVADCGIMGIRFDEAAKILYLPVITLDNNSEVIIRNLMAYESCVAGSGPRIFCGYVEFMSKIVVAGEDVKVLREQGIVVNDMRCGDEGVAKLWNEMIDDGGERSELTRLPFLDVVIRKVGECYDGSCRVGVGKLFATRGSRSRQSMIAMATVVVVVFVAVQGICSLLALARRKN
ncbi:hypothetical protein M569_14127 [Genlisea aurea]|uniref:Uncharacterized protein n=1 Tax=Genlisea aurea TaxID=192259 RepID=S8DCZ0_9LAMI|nr:hypothetical protein M569_14127 [Genlisea aurea]